MLTALLAELPIYSVYAIVNSKNIVIGCAAFKVVNFPVKCGHVILPLVEPFQLPVLPALPHKPP